MGGQGEFKGSKGWRLGGGHTQSFLKIRNGLLEVALVGESCTARHVGIAAALVQPQSLRSSERIRTR